MQNTKHLQQQQNGWRKQKQTHTHTQKKKHRVRERREKKMCFTQFNDTDKLLAYQTAYFSIQFIIVQTMQHLFLLNWGTCSTLPSSIYPLYCTATDIFITYKLRFLEVFSYIYIYIYIFKCSTAMVIIVYILQFTTTILPYMYSEIRHT